MVEVWLPYGSSEIPARVPEERLTEILRPTKAKNVIDVTAEGKRLLELNPNLLERAAKAHKICIALGESKNRKLTADLLRWLVQTLREVGPPNSIEVLSTADAPDIDSNIVPDVRVIRHDLHSSPTVPFAESKTEFPVALNAEFVAADLKILLGELRPHHFREYSGLCDIVLPGLASTITSQAQLSSRKGIEISDINKERVQITKSIPSLFSLGFVLDADLLPAAISLGSIQDTLNDMKHATQQLCVKKIEKTSDIVVMSAGGVPSDESLLRATETIPAGLAAAKRDGALIVAAECAAGHGNTEFYEWCAERKEPRHLETRLRHNFNYHGFKAVFLLRALENHRIYLVSTIPDHYVEDTFGMRAATTINSALQTAQRTLGTDSTITVIPDANYVIPRKTE